MAKGSSSSESSLELRELLETEFVALHGDPPAAYPKSAEPETRLKEFYNTCRLG